MTVCSDSIEVYLSTREILLRLGEFVTSCWTSETLLSVFFSVCEVSLSALFVNNFLEYLLSLARDVTVNTWKSWIRMCAALKSLDVETERKCERKTLFFKAKLFNLCQASKKWLFSNSFPQTQPWFAIGEQTDSLAPKLTPLVEPVLPC